MKKEEKKVPQLRFPKFKGDWEQRKLSDITLKIGSGKTPSGGKNAYVDDGIPLIRSQNINNDRVDLEDIVFIDEETDNSMENSRVFTDDVLLNITGASIGRSAVYRGKDKANVNQHVCIIRPTKDFDSDFIQLNLASNFGQKQIDASQAGGGREGLNFQEIGKMSFMFPSNQEQMKIGVYFNHIDYLITLHQRKLEKIRELKKGMLQKMFPKNGKKVPEIRFKGFTDDWEQRKFLDCYKMSSGYAFKMRDYCDSGIGLINGESIQHGIINDDNLNYLPESFIQQYPDFILKEGDIVVGLNRPITNGNLKIARIPNKYNDSLLYQRAGKIVYKGNCDKDFTYILLSKEILKYTLVEAVGSDQPFISTSKLDKWQMMIPSDIEEQKKIGDYFRNLDHLITLHQRKLEKIKELKKGLLQQMFV
jgi:type I restriction enzyme S subunit